MLEKPGALIEMSREWLSGSKATWNEQKHRWAFPSGATLTFGHMKDAGDVYNYQGANYHLVVYDELTQFSEGQYRYLFSRTRRRAGDAVPIRVRATSNPGGEGHEWVKKRFISAAPTADRIFIPAKLDDNPNLDRAEYLLSLAELDPVTRAQLLAGDWDAYEGGRYRREWLRHYTRTTNGWWRFGENKVYMPEQITHRFLTVDPAATVKKLAKDDPDYTVISAWGLSPCGYLVWLGCARLRCEIPDIPGHVAGMYARHKAGKAYIEGFGIGQGPAQLCRRHPAKLNVVEVTPKGKDKLTNASNALNMAEAGRVWLPADDPSFPLEEVEGELLRFTGDERRDGHDDVVDTLSIAGNQVTSGTAGQHRLPVAEPLRAGPLA